MSLSNILSPNYYDLYCDNLTAKNVDLVTINNAPYPPGGGSIPDPLVSNKVLRVNGAGTTMLWGDVSPSNLTGGAVGDVLKTVAPSVVAWAAIDPGDITPGLPNQIFHVTSDGSACEFTSDVIIPGLLNVDSTLNVDGSSTFQSNSLFNQNLVVDQDLIINNGNITITNGELDVPIGNTSLASLNITGNLTFNGSSGINSQVLGKTGPFSQTWISLIPVNLIRYVAYFNSQDLNAIAGVSPAVFNTSVQQSNVTRTTSTISLLIGFSQSSSTVFTTGHTAIYDADFNIYIDHSSSGIGNSIVTVSLEIAGVEQPFCLCNNSGNFISGKIASVAITAGANVRVLLRRIVGTGQLNIFGFPSVVPNFSSTVCFSLVRTIP